eukprot:6711407-Ditylum_brightwellii.AAC.1
MEAVSSDDPTIGQKQPGGACIGINGNSVGALVQSGKDDTGLGRWVYACIGGREQRKLYIVVAYRPCKQSNPGDSIVNAQQKRLLIQQGETNPNPRKTWCKDMLRQIEIWAKHGE